MNLSNLDLQSIPKRAADLFNTLTVSPRLGVHLLLVYDVAIQIMAWLKHYYPKLEFDEEAVLFGAITHDIGKVVCHNEIFGPGSTHEQIGYELLVDHGIEKKLARFTRTHSAWTATETTMDDWLVSLADKIWKGKRVPDLEQLIVMNISTATKSEPWEVFLCLDDLLNDIIKDADSRLAIACG